MIPSPIRTTAVSRVQNPPQTVTGAQGGDADNVDAFAALDARITALTARLPSPDDEALQRQREAFDFITQTRAELERETNALRDLAMDQMKHEDEFLKKWIEMI